MSKKNEINLMARRYPRLIEWSEEDGCFIGSAPPLVGQCCHGVSEAEVAGQLSAIVLDLVEDVIDGKIPMPKDLAGKSYSGKFLTRVDPALHRKLALQAAARRESLNDFVAHALEHA